jgi:hypothetical protein
MRITPVSTHGIGSQNMDRATKHQMPCLVTHLTRKTSETSISRLPDSADVFRYVYWGSDIAENPPSVHYDEIMADDKGVGKWTDKIVEPSSMKYS